MSPKSRPSIPKNIETQVLTSSLRRCPLCFGLEGDSSIKSGQIAHLDRDSTNNAIGNLVFLCLRHHDEYDSRTSQSKGITRHEILHHLATLHEAISSGSLFLIMDKNVCETTRINSGLYFLASDGAARANIAIYSSSADYDGCSRVEIYGESYFGIDRPGGPNVGTIHTVLRKLNVSLFSYASGEYLITLQGRNNCIVVDEENPQLKHGMNVTFSGTYRPVQSPLLRLKYKMYFYRRKLMRLLDQ